MVLKCVLIVLQKQTINSVVQISLRPFILSNTPWQFVMYRTKLRVNLVKLLLHDLSGKVRTTVDVDVHQSTKSGDPSAVE